VHATGSPSDPSGRPWVLPLVAAVLLLGGIANSAAYALAARVGRYWPAYVLGPQPAGIVLHHSATDAGSDPWRLRDGIDRGHAGRGWGAFFGGRVYHIGYHYLVSPEGKVLPGRPEWLPGAHCQGHNDTIGVCLLGNLAEQDSGRAQHPTPAQMDALVGLVKDLMRKYGLSPEQVYLHRDLGPTECPGEGFPREEFYRRLRRSGSGP